MSDPWIPAHSQGSSINSRLCIPAGSSANTRSRPATIRKDGQAIRGYQLSVSRHWNPPKCQSMWQWRNQGPRLQVEADECDEKTITSCTPGLSVRNLMRVGSLLSGLRPLATTSRRGGFTKLAPPPLADCTTEKACPLKFQTFIGGVNFMRINWQRTANGTGVHPHQ